MPAARASLGTGGVAFVDDPAGGLVVHVRTCLAGLRDGPHGFHIHESSDTSRGCASMGGHWNPGGHDHGAPGDAPPRRHAGDLGNVLARGGCVDARIRVPDARVADVVGRGVVLHAGADDLGRGGTAESRRTGSAGARLACAPIVPEPATSGRP